jgi:hypothetical protein
MDAEVAGKKEMCWLYGKVGGSVANQSCGRGRIWLVMSQWE